MTAYLFGACLQLRLLLFRLLRSLSDGRTQIRHLLVRSTFHPSSVSVYVMLPCACLARSATVRQRERSEGCWSGESVNSGAKSVACNA